MSNFNSASCPMTYVNSASTDRQFNYWMRLFTTIAYSIGLASSLILYFQSPTILHVPIVNSACFMGSLAIITLSYVHRDHKRYLSYTIGVILGFAIGITSCMIQYGPLNYLHMAILMIYALILFNLYYHD